MFLEHVLDEYYVLYDIFEFSSCPLQSGLHILKKVGCATFNYKGVSALRLNDAPLTKTVSIMHLYYQTVKSSSESGIFFQTQASATLFVKKEKPVHFQTWLFCWYRKALLDKLHACISLHDKGRSPSFALLLGTKILKIKIISYFSSILFSNTMHGFDYKELTCQNWKDKSFDEREVFHAEIDGQFSHEKSISHTQVVFWQKIPRTATRRTRLYKIEEIKALLKKSWIMISTVCSQLSSESINS